MKRKKNYESNFIDNFTIILDDDTMSPVLNMSASPLLADAVNEFYSIESPHSVQKRCRILHSGEVNSPVSVKPVF